MIKLFFLIYSLFFIFIVFNQSNAQEYYFKCNDKNTSIEDCAIITDGKLAIKRQFIKDDSSSDSILQDGKYDNFEIKNGFVENCKMCKDKERSPMLMQKFIELNKFDKKYYKYIKNNKITNLQEFNKNGYFLAFKDTNSDRYLIVFKGYDDKLHADFSHINTFFASPDCRDVANFHINSDNFTVTILKEIKESNFKKLSIKEIANNRVDLRIKDCKVVYYHKYYPQIIDKILKK